jgi:23S rRNA (cytosine1962-C5)-methyltransferase
MNFLTKHQNFRSRLPEYDVHPISIKMIEQGNPWITADKYTEKFHPHDRFIVALNRKRPFALLLHDPTHANVKARLWARNGNFDKVIKNFKNDFAQRMHAAFKLRKDLKISEKRNNYYLVFGEADYIPGLHVQYLAGEILIQFYANYWDKYQDFVIQTVIKKMDDVFHMDVMRSQLWLQTRVDGNGVKEPPRCLDPNTTFKNVIVEEFGAKYRINLGSHYDIGIYTDMSSVRQALIPEFQQAKSLLNLYAYTGAFSLCALASGVAEVTSVDLSDKYVDWLQENLELNAKIDSAKHTSLNDAALEGLNKLKTQNKKFDLIICDPPTSSSDGQKRSNALKDYERLIPAMYKVLSDNGKIIVFLNTHQVNKKKFQEKLMDIFAFHHLPLKSNKFFGLGDDCPAMPKFPEGSYLKGYMLEIDPTKIKQKPKIEAPSEVEVIKEEEKIIATSEESPEHVLADTVEVEVIIQKDAKPKTAKKVTKKTAKKVTTKSSSDELASKPAKKKVAKKAAKKVTKKVDAENATKPAKKVAKKTAKKATTKS